MLEKNQLTQLVTLKFILMKVKYISKISKVQELTNKEVELYEPVTKKFMFRTNSYYNDLIDWSDPNDPIRRLIIPQTEELLNWGQLDASEEASYQPIPGIEHKYSSTVLLLCNDVCAAYCRFCFRKRLFQDDNDEVVKDVSSGIAYIKEHPEVNNVLLTGGDPLVMSTARIEKIIKQLCEIEHVKNIRIGTKLPAFNPHRILDDPSLGEMIKTYSKVKQIYGMVHFDHPTELTDLTVSSLKFLQAAGATVVNQTPIIAGVNDSPEVMNELFNKLSFIGIITYYVFACRPTEGNKTYAVPVEQAYEIFNEAKNNGSGLAKTARFILSHKIGKIEVLGLTEKLILFKCHNLANNGQNGKIMAFKRNPKAYWFDDYENFEVVI
ncbi:KamA family radical SAM protein [Fulvivirgaceae bacterium BMA12]|uniref:KamA family radical SAM protein n=1 Tax=Agaribacillus aureus TaxID=3051825 RepID=A0ABT8LM48_9BACT|nr:KamA family radical SAM protein [Fulvivirgaceae bacterium BMA12]